MVAPGVRAETERGGSMAILSESEFEAVLTRMIRTIEKLIYQQHNAPKLEQVRRELETVLEIMLDPDKEKPSPEQLQAFTKATETLRGLGTGIADLDDDSFDVEDYVMYRL